MTASEAIARAKDMRQGAIDYSQYLKWINIIEGRIQVEVMGKKQSEMIVYTEKDDNTELLVTSPYDEIYIFYLCAMTDYYNEELDAYENDALIFEKKFSEFKAYYGKNNSSTEKANIYGWWKS